MITEKHYTDKNEHPEDRIFAAKNFINELENVQTFYYNQLLLDLNLKEEADDYLFDYVYNENAEISFEEYLNRINKSYDEFHNS
jgi:predicted N-formylglutamate amidohydrolase